MESLQSMHYMESLQSMHYMESLQSMRYMHYMHMGSMHCVLVVAGSAVESVSLAPVTAAAGVIVDIVCRGSCYDGCCGRCFTCCCNVTFINVISKICK